LESYTQTAVIHGEPDRHAKMLESAMKPPGYKPMVKKTMYDFTDVTSSTASLLLDFNRTFILTQSFSQMLMHASTGSTAVSHFSSFNVRSRWSCITGPTPCSTKS
jgi:hypothetical protein